MNTYRRPPVVFTHGRGCRLYDSQGREYLDFLAGIAVNALGYAHPRMVRVIRREAGRATHVSNLFHNPVSGAARAQARGMVGSRPRVFRKQRQRSDRRRAEAGARLRACEVRTAPARRRRRASSRWKIPFMAAPWARSRSPDTPKYREPFEPLVPGVEFVRFNDVADLDAKFDDTVCAIVIEPIQGEGGVNLVSEEFWEPCSRADHGTRRRADRRRNSIRPWPHRPPFRISEIHLAARYRHRGQAARRRPCRWARSSPAKNSRLPSAPECTAPLSAAARWSARRRSNSSPSSKRKSCSTTFARAAPSFAQAWRRSPARFDFIREVRGEGLIIGIDLSIEGAPFVAEALRQGLLINCTHDHILRLLPPFIIRQRDVAEFLRKFEIVLARGAKAVAKTAASTAKSESKSQPLVLAAAR